MVSNATWLEVLNRDWNEIAPIAFYYDPDAPNANENSAELKDFYFSGQPVNSGSLVPLGEVSKIIKTLQIVSQTFLL